MAQKLSERAEVLHNEKQELETTEHGRGAREALESLDSPEVFLRELLSESVSEGVIPQIPPEMSLLLANVEPENREIYERIISYMQGDNRADSDVVKPISLPEFNAEIEKVSEHTAMELRHMEHELQTNTEVVYEHMESTSEQKVTNGKGGDRTEINVVKSVSLPELNAEIEKARGYTTMELRHMEHELQTNMEVSQERVDRTVEKTAADVVVRGVTRGSEIPPLQLLHRQQETSEASTTGSDQFVTAEQPTTQSEIFLKETILREKTTESEIHRMVQDSQVRNTEEINTMIHRALNAQIGTIAGQVYNHVERRLHMERARRGK
jgi:hypothetical protein